ncbi:hypothetical protein BOW49_12910 [Solemya velum gill symbiont]|uniref:Permease n=1 Tax=Solemya velum gill symbiont TaxID=2340 RepID=A0A0B0H767_SOVGS|nr:DMT family transporter [Solemya velum gill symbiont]KHF26038.1 permease [Solemya velum gill symbiont]OOZ71324.1 hypothetical protein BOW49_12910 [Solemya velum gill symbiont]
MHKQHAVYAPYAFVFLWSTGFIGAKYALPFIEPFTLLAMRFIIALAVLLQLFRYFKPDLKLDRVLRAHLMASGLMVHGAYLGGVFTAVKLGMPAGVIALLVGLQPILTAAVTPVVFHRRIPMLHWIAVALGFIGILLVLIDKASFEGFGTEAVIAGTVALVGITFGTIYQKRVTAGVDVLSVAYYQYIATAIAFTLAALMFEEQVIEWSAQLLMALAWLVFGLSIGAILLLNYLIKLHEAHKTSSLFYLVPPLTAVEAYLLFDEKLSLINMAGMVLVVVAVYLVMKKNSASD